MKQVNLFEEYENENEDDLLQNSETFEQAVVWATDWTTETITNQLIKGNIDLKPRFQRRDAWTKVAKSRFIESLFLGLPIPQIILAEKKVARGKYVVIDGKQRLLTIRNFFAKAENDDFQALKLTGLKILTQLNGKTYQQLVSDPDLNQLVNQLQNQSVRTTVIKNWPNEAFLFTVFLRLNTGSIKLSPQELRQALHPGSFIDYADIFSIESDAIKRMLGLETPDFRMRDVEIVIRYFTYKYFIEQYDGNLKTAFDNTVKKLNEEWNQREQDILVDSKRLESAIDFVMKIFGDRASFSKWTGENFQNNFNRAVFDIMVFYFSDDKILKNSENHAEKIVQEFKLLCEKNKEFLNSLEQTTKSIQNNFQRLNLWGEKLAEILNMKIEVPVLENNRLILKPSQNG